jgi:hypothetical protein
MGATMTCPEYLSLRDVYEASLRQWAKVMRLRDETHGDAKLAAFDQRGEALSKMTSHAEFCPNCRMDNGRIKSTWLERHRRLHTERRRTTEETGS